jgi:hypothetical protein
MGGSVQLIPNRLICNYCNVRGSAEVLRLEQLVKLNWKSLANLSTAQVKAERSEVWRAKISLLIIHTSRLRVDRDDNRWNENSLPRGSDGAHFNQSGVNWGGKETLLGSVRGMKEQNARKVRPISSSIQH